MSKTATVTIGKSGKTPKAQSPVLIRLKKEKGLSEEEVHQKIWDLGVERQRAIFNDRDNRNKDKPAKAPKSSAKKTSKKTSKKAASKKVSKRSARKSSTKKASTKKASKSKDKNGKSKGLSADQRAQIQDFKDAGFTNADIAKEMGISKDQVYRALKG